MSGVSHTTDDRSDRDDPLAGGAPVGFGTLVDVLRWRAQDHPDAPAFTFLADGERIDATVSFWELDQRARAIAAELTARGAGRGEVVLLVFAPGVPYLEAFYGCLYAGAIAVPVYPPDPYRLQRTLPRLQAIVASAGARWALTSRAMAEGTRLAELSGAELLLLDDFDRRADDAPLHVPAPSDVAFLQYTSGSTGSPRGVALRQGNLMENCRSMHQSLDVPRAIGVHWLPPYHDMGLIGALLLPISSGRQTISMSPLAFMQKPIRWLRAIERFGGTSSGAPNFGYELCVRKIKPQESADLDLSTWQVAVSGAEPVRAATLRAFSERFAPCGFRAEAFVPAFGMAEATLMVSSKPRGRLPRVTVCDAQQLEQDRVRALSSRWGEEGDRREGDGREGDRREVVSCGPPAPGVEVKIVDPQTRLPMGDDRVGEIWVSSPGNGQGYWNDPQATAATFDVPLANAADGPTYLRTGDLGFLLDGELHITGRRKELIILGGRNLYPLDIEQSVQSCHPDLKMDGGAAFSVTVDNESQLVVVQELLRPRRHDLPALLAQARQAVLEETGVAPMAIAFIAAGSLPKTSSGKTKRRACREAWLRSRLSILAQWPEVADETTGTASSPPETEMERQLAPLWADALDLPSVGRSDDFFHLGGQSLRVASMLSRVREQLRIDVSLDLLFQNSTLSAFAEALERCAPCEDGDALSDYLQGEVADALDAYPLSFAQQRFWFLERFGAGGAGLHIPLHVELQGDLDVGRLEERLLHICRGHDVLRASFGESQGLPQQSLTPPDDVAPSWSVLDLIDDATPHRDERLASWRHNLIEQPFDLRRPPLLRCGLAMLEEGRAELTVVLHHLVADGWSAGLLLHQLGQPSVRGDGRRYVDYSRWQHDAVAAETEARAHWRARLAEAPAALDLPLEPASDPTGSEECRADLPPALNARLNEVAAGCGATPFMVHLAAYQILLSRYCGVHDLCVGTVTANRDRVALESMFGCFINTLALRGEVREDESFDAMLRRVRANTLQDLRHGAQPWEQVLQDLQPRRFAGRLPLVQALLIQQSELPLPAEIAGARVAGVAAGLAGLEEFELALVLEPASKGAATARLRFRRDRLNARLAQRMLDAYLAILRSVAENSGRSVARLLPPTRDERMEVQVERNATDRQLPCNDVVALLERQFDQGPERIAVRWRDQQIRCGELEQQSNRLAHYLTSQGVGPDVRVGIQMRRSPRMLVAVLGVLKAGGAYVPLDPAFPPQRLDEMIADCRPKLILTDVDEFEACGADSSRSPSARSHSARPGGAVWLRWSEWEAEADNHPPRRPPHRARGEHLAYVIYTSGSTGRPKGVMVPHRGVVNFLCSMARRPGMEPERRVLAHTTMSFDISVLELLLPLSVGAEIVLAPCGAARDGRALRQLIESHQVDYIQSTPSSFRLLLAAGWRPADGQRLLCGGEAVAPDLAQLLAAPGVELWNVYGPTETTVWSTICRLKPGETGAPPIGHPIDNTRVYVLDQQMRPVPTGAAGELYIGGLGVCRGYWERPELTAERFVSDPFDDRAGCKLYRTGDRVRWRADGKLQFLERVDSQVKVRGFRVELGEVESALNSHPSVAEAAACCHDDSSGAVLAGYLVPRSGAAAPAPDQLREHLASRLPDYMIPSAFVTLDQLPRTPAGKLDRRRLPELGAAEIATSSRHVAPSSPLERQIAEMWAEVLGRPQIGVEDNFFELGGHSLKAAQLLARVESETGLRLNVAEFFRQPTVAGVAAHILQLQAAAGGDDLESLLAELESMSEEEVQQRLGVDAESRPPGRSGP